MHLHIANNIEKLNITVADWLVQYAAEVLQKQDRFTIALSGGKTPKLLHELLASETYKNKFDWSKWHVFFGDERFVPFTDERNNAKMAFETLLNQVPIPLEQVHVMQTDHINPEESALAYEKILHHYFDQSESSFDLVLLGMGDDGHTLSLFPGSPVVHETHRWTTSLWLASQDMFRITLTHSIVNHSAAVAFLAAGNLKATVLKEVLNGDYNPDLYPSQIIQPEHGQLHWFVDEAAASAL